MRMSKITLDTYWNAIIKKVKSCMITVVCMENFCGERLGNKIKTAKARIIL